MNKADLKELALRLKNYTLSGEIRVMEVCGTHTTEFFRSGVRNFLPDGFTLIDGPGCPVCVTPNSYMDTAIEIAKHYDTIIVTFGDMMRVPSSYSSLAGEKASGMDIEVVYSPLDALKIAENNRDREIVFLSIGFETTAPTEAVTVLEAKNRNIKNFTILPGNKLTPPAVKALLEAEEVNIDGFILPGHVSTIIGTAGWRFISDNFNRPGVVAGFGEADLIIAALKITELLTSEKISVENEYASVVKENGNIAASNIIRKVFCHEDSSWRGLGIIPGSGLVLADEYDEFNAITRFPVRPPEPVEAKGCKCGELLRGIIIPTQCGLFAKTCTPEHPVGPCMVSLEGPCAAYYKYGGSDER